MIKDDVWTHRCMTYLKELEIEIMKRAGYGSLEDRLALVVKRLFGYLSDLESRELEADRIKSLADGLIDPDDCEDCEDCDDVQDELDDCRWEYQELKIEYVALRKAVWRMWNGLKSISP